MFRPSLLSAGAAVLACADAASLVALAAALSDDAAVLTQAWERLSVLMQGDAGKLAAADSGAIEVLCASLTRHVSNEGLVIKACIALGFVSDHLANRERAGAAGACEAVLAVLTANSGSAVVAEKVFVVLDSLTFRHPANQERAGTAGACEAAVAALAAHRDNTVVAARVCVVLRNMTWWHPGNLAKSGNAGACEAVVAALAAHSDSETVAEHACHALANLLNLQANATRAAAAGGRETLEKALRSHPGEARIQQWGGVAIGRLPLASSVDA